MKLAVASLAATAHAGWWNGHWVTYDMGGPGAFERSGVVEGVQRAPKFAGDACGMDFQQEIESNMVNSTCTIAGSHIRAIYAGNGAFITGNDGEGSFSMTGYDGISGRASVVVFFDQLCDEWGCNNATCFDAALECVDDGIATDGVFFMETVNYSRTGNINLQISGLKAGDQFSVALNDDKGNGVEVRNISAPFGISTKSEDGFGTFAMTVNEDFKSDLFQVSVVSDQVIDLWRSTIAADGAN